MVQSVHLSICPSVCLSVTPFSLCSHNSIIMKFSGVIVNDRSDVYDNVYVRQKVPEIFLNPFQINDDVHDYNTHQSQQQHVPIAGTLGCVFIDNETHESGVTKCTTGEAWSAFSWHHSSVFHCQWTHNQVFLLLSHMLIKNAKSMFIYVMKYVSGFIWKLGINFALFIKWIDETWWNNRLLLVPNCYEVVAMVATMVAMVAPLWCHTLR